MSMKICIAGKNDIAVESAGWLLESGLVSQDDLLVCFNKTDDGVDTFQRSLRKFARERGLAENTLNQLYMTDDLVFFSLEFDRIIKPARFSLTTSSLS